MCISTLHLCWGAQAGLYFHYGIAKRPLGHKMFGVFSHHTECDNFTLFRGFDDIFYIPHSRHTEIAREDVEAIPELTIMASSKEGGIYAIKTENGRQIYMMGHAEYDRDTLKHEYERDVKAGKPIDLPKHCFPDDDPARQPVNNWRSSGHMIYANWVNCILYQTTPYDITAIGR